MKLTAMNSVGSARAWLLLLAVVYSIETTRSSIVPKPSLSAHGIRTPDMNDIMRQADVNRQGKIQMIRTELNQMVEQLEDLQVQVPEGQGAVAGGEGSVPMNGLELSTIYTHIDVLRHINSSDNLLEAWHEHMTLERDDPIWNSSSPGASAIPPLSCDIKHRSDTRPTSVHELRPGDIDIVGAMGDSITAAFGAGATSLVLFQYKYEYRGRSWSAGGDKSYPEGVITLPNILKEFNPNIKGFSHDVIGLFEDPKTSDKVELNVAITGAIAQDMTEQAERFIQKVIDDPSMDMENDWKMITLFIGANNLCDACNDESKHAAETFKEELTRALDTLKQHVPRLFVNVIEIFDVAPVTQLANFKLGKLICSALLLIFDACPCGHYDEEDTTPLTRASRGYQRAVQELIDSGRYDDKEDFTVVAQPFFREFGPPKTRDAEPDMSFFAQDCFHFSNKGHNRAGKALWNSIMEPVGSKRDNWNVDEPLKCPTTEYIPTKQNSI